MSVPAPVGHDEKVAGFPFQYFALDVGDTTAFDRVVKLVRGVTMFGGLLAGVELLDPAGKSREGRAAGDRTTILQTFPVERGFAPGQHFCQRTARLRPLIDERVKRLAARAA